MEIITKCNGVRSTHQINPQPITALVHQSGIKVEAPSAYTITSEMTLKCMKEMSQKAWVHISAGPLFQHFFGMLFRGSVTLPQEVSVLCEDYDDGVIHGCGLIVLLVEAMFEGRQEVYLAYPETFLHPLQQQWLMSVIMGIQQLSGGPGANPDAALQSQT